MGLRTWWKRWAGKKDSRLQGPRNIPCQFLAENNSKDSCHSTKLADNLSSEQPVRQAADVDDLSSVVLPPIPQAVDVDNLSSEQSVRQAFDVNDLSFEPLVRQAIDIEDLSSEPSFQKIDEVDNLPVLIKQGIELQPASTFEVLANELIQEIIRLVPHPQKSLSLCSKRLHILTEPILYAFVSLRHQKSYPWFIRTISCRPHLANFVKKFHTSAYNVDWNFDLDFIADKSWVRRNLPSVYGESACNHWFREIFAFRSRYRMLIAAAWDAIIAFLFCLFSGLQSIDMKPCGLLVAKYSHIHMVLEQASRDKAIMDSMSQGLLSNLRSVSIEGSQEARSLSTNFVLPFLEIKSVSRFRVTNVRDWGVRPEFTLPSLETADVALLDSYLSSRSIQEIVPLFNSLRRFQYHYGVNGRQYHHLRPTFSFIKESLLNSRRTLEQLMISDGRREVQQALTRRTGIGSLRDFTRLRYGIFSLQREYTTLRRHLIENSVIKADASVLVGEEYRTVIQNDEVLFEMTHFFDQDQCINFVHSLPTNLEHLTIWRNTSAIFNCLEYMFPLVGSALPTRLRSMTLFFRDRIGVPSYSVMQDWAERASTFGVVLTWERTSKGIPDDQWQ